MAKIKLYELLNGYETSSGDDFVGKRFLRREITGNITVNSTKKSKSKLNAIQNKISDFLLYSNVKSYGLLLLTFGLLTVLSYFAYDFILGLMPEHISLGENRISLTLGVVISILSIPLLALDGPICSVFQDYPITDAVLYDFLCIKRVTPKTKGAEVHAAPFVLFGIFLSLLGIAVPTSYICIGLCLLAFLGLGLLSPEFALFSSILVLPYISLDRPEGYGILTTLVIITALSFLRKMVFGKRVFNFEQYDFFLSLMLLFMLVCGIFVSGVESFTSSIKYILLTLVYILAGNIITNRRLADCACKAIVFSSFLPALISLVTFIVGASRGEASEIIKSGISSLYSSKEVAAAHFTVSLILSIIMIFQSKGASLGGYIFVSFVNTLGLALTFEPFAYLAFLLGAIACLVFYKGKKRCLFILPLAAVPYAFIILASIYFPSALGFSGDGVAYSELLSLWKETALEFLKNPFGIGIGSAAFAEKFGNLDALNSHNLFLEIALEAGALALLAFLAIIFARVRHRMNYRRYLRHSDINLVTVGAGAAIFALISLGATAYIWQDLSLYYLFWYVFGIGSAGLRIAKQENDDRVLYYQIDRDVDSFDVSVNLDKK